MIFVHSLQLRIRHKVFLVTLLFAGMGLISLTLLSKHFLADRFGEQEQHATQAGFNQSKEWLIGRANTRASLAMDWGTWDESYEQIGKPSEDFRRISLRPADLDKAGNNLYLMLDTNGLIVDQVCNPACPQIWISQVQKMCSLWHKQNLTHSTGIESIGNRFYALGIAEVVPHSHSAARRGYILMGELLKPQHIPIPGGLGRVILKPGPLDSLSLTESELRLAGPDSIEGASNLPHIQTLTGAVLWARLPRLFYHEGLQSLRYLLFWLCCLGALGVLGLLMYLQYSVVRRIEFLREDLVQVGNSGQGARVRVLGTDDLGELSTQVNVTLERLDATRAEFTSHQHFDQITGLPNRKHFLELMHSAFVNPMILVLISLERLQRISDTYGTNAGEQLLLHAAQRLELIPKLQHLARVSPHEFAFLFELEEQKSLVRFAEQLHGILETPISLDAGREVQVQINIGICIAHEFEQLAPEEVMRRAEVSLHAQQHGQKSNAIAQFDPELDKRSRDQIDLEKDLRLAVERDEFIVAYQPILELSTLRLVGFESLIRWQHPTKGLISPLSFIPLAEEIGLIEKIGEIVLRESCNQVVKWSSEIPEIADSFISVNLSVRQFRDPLLITKIYHAVQGSGLAFERLKLEITESSIMDDPQQCSRRLHELHDLGIRLSLDDFGTGYSSFTYLDRFPVHTLKLDKSFVDKLLVDPESPIVRSVVTVAQVMNWDLVAEGVEKESQAESLRRMGCGYVQGYLFGKPMFPAAVEAWVVNRKTLPVPN